MLTLEELPIKLLLPLSRFWARETNPAVRPMRKRLGVLVLLVIVCVSIVCRFGGTNSLLFEQVRAGIRFGDYP